MTEPTQFLDTFPAPLAGSSAGIPYPTPTDPLMEGAAAIQAVAGYLAAHGLGDSLLGVAAITSGTSLDTVTKSGSYYSNSWLQAPVAAGVWGVVTVLAYDPSNIIQTFRDLLATPNMGRVWERRKIAGTWYGWNEARRSVSGSVSSAGAIEAGTQYTTAKTATGRYDLGFVPAFGGIPSLTVALRAARSAGGAGNNRAVCIEAVTAATAIVWTYDVSSNANVDTGFCFQAVSL